MTDSGLSELPPDQDPKNQIRCHRCGDPITDWKETRRYGFWDAESATYESHGGIEEHFCRNCWDEDYGRTNGAHFRPETAEQLYAVLEASEGDLAAILTWWSRNPAIRVVNGEPEAVVTEMRRDGEAEDGTPHIRLEAKQIEDYPREKFDEDAAPPENQNLVLLRDLEYTKWSMLDTD